MKFWRLVKDINNVKYVYVGNEWNPTFSALESLGKMFKSPSVAQKAVNRMHAASNQKNNKLFGSVNESPIVGLRLEEVETAVNTDNYIFPEAF